MAFIPTFVLTPLTYLGGVFYSVALLPDPWKHISYGNLVLYMVNAFRYGVLSISDVPLILSFVILFLFIGILFVANWYLIEKGVGLKN